MYEVKQADTVDWWCDKCPRWNLNPALLRCLVCAVAQLRHDEDAERHAWALTASDAESFGLRWMDNGSPYWQSYLSESIITLILQNCVSVAPT